VSSTLWVFKLFNSIKDEHEVKLAELELQSLFGPVERVRNFYDIIYETPLKLFCENGLRVQDVLTYEPCYGECQGFIARTAEPLRASMLARRLAYTREFLLVTPGTNAAEIQRKIFPEGKLGNNIGSYAKDGYVLLRIIPNQFFLEKSFYISKLSRHEQDINKNVESLLSYPFEKLYRIPASATMSVGKRLEDYFTIREEISLYLIHVWHPYKAKFHSKMARALLNYICPDDDALVMDNWAGSGTLNVEATLMGLENIGLEINPLSVLMANVKCQALSVNPKELKAQAFEFLDELKGKIASFRSGTSTTTLLQYGKGGTETFDSSSELRNVTDEANKIKQELKGLFVEDQLQEFIIARKLIEESYNGLMRDLLLLALSGSISDLARRRKGRLYEVMTLRLLKLMYLRLYLYGKLNETLGIQPGKSATYVCDNRAPFATSKTLNGERAKLAPGTVDAIVTSPPYSTAVDYIRNDFPQLTVLKMLKSREELEELEKNLEGNPKARLYRDPSLLKEVENESRFYEILPDEAKESIQKLRKAGRDPEALRSYKFFKDMYSSLIAMNRLLKKGGKCAIVIGNNHYKISEEEVEEVQNDRILFELARRGEVGFVPDKGTGGFIGRPLEKTQAGYIRNETVLILEKVTDAPKPNPL
jgi:DNA modification methylase